MTITEAKQRMQSLRWGVFNHFLYSAPSADIHYVPAMTDWNRRVEMFDAERVAYDLHTVGAGYYFITLMQGRKYMCAPNATFDRIAGTKPGEACSHRDLIWDISEALAKYDIDLYLYYTGDGPYQDVEIGERFGFLEPRKNVSMTFAKNWASVLEEYSVRYGGRVKGYWIDGCYDFFGYNQELLVPYYEAVKKGNPSALVTMNNGVKDDLYRWIMTKTLHLTNLMTLPSFRAPPTFSRPCRTFWLRSAFLSTAIRGAVGEDRAANVTALKCGTMSEKSMPAAELSVLTFRSAMTAPLMKNSYDAWLKSTNNSRTTVNDNTCGITLNKNVERILQLVSKEDGGMKDKKS